MYRGSTLRRHTMTVLIIILGLWFWFGRLELARIMRNYTGDPDIEPTFLEVIVFMILALFVANAADEVIKQMNK